MTTTNAPAIERLLYPKKEAAYALGISVRSLDYMIANKRLRFAKLGKKVLIPAAELRRVALRTNL